MDRWSKILASCLDIIMAGCIFFLLTSSQAVEASEILAPPTRRSVTADWVEIVVVVATSIIIYILGSLYASGQWVWGWKKSEHLRVLAERNDNNYVKIRRYTTPFHLVVAVLVHYFLENIYFLVVVIFQMFCGCSPTGKHSTYPGLIIAAAAKLILTAAEEANLYFDERKANSSKYQQIIYDRSPAQQENNALAAWAGVASDIAQDITSGEICRGRVVVVKNGELVPVDGIILASSEPLTTPILFNEAGLTGESAPAAKFPLNIGVDYSQCPEIKDFASVARCVRHRLTTLDPVIQADEPTTSNVQFAGTIIRPRKLPEREADIVVANFDFKNAAYRGSTLHGTEWVLLLAVYTGPATKERLVTIKKTGVKDTPLDKELGKLIMNWNLPFIGILSLAATLHAFYLTHGTDVSSLTSLAALKHVGLEWIVNFLFLNGLNNLSTRFFGDVVRIGQCRNMSVDSHMVIETNRAIPDSLGNVQVIISDKTGTLTKNELKCEKLIINCDPFASTPQEFSLTNPAGIKQAIQRRDDHSKAVERFLTFMAVANGVMPKARPNAENLTKETVYFSSNPDDLEFVNIAKALDTELMERFTSTEGQQFVRVRTRLDDAPEEDEVRWHTVKMQLLQEHEFVSSRKYMSAVLKCPGSGGELNLRSSLSSSPCQVLLVLKGADEKVDAKLSSESPYKNRLIDLVSPYTREGKRVLVWAYKFIPLQDYERWEKERPASTKDAEAIESWWKLIERDLHFAGCTIVSDKLQDGVEDVITYARECGIKVVMATGDSADTAESIWRKLRQIQGPVHRLVYNSFTTLNSEQRVVLDEPKLRDSLAQFDAIKADDRAVLLIDGDMLLALQKARRERRKFAKSLDKFDSVVAARMTAAQKAEINRLYQSLGKTTLAIGDGANDITMIQEATVSVGLKSAETESAAQAADFKIQEFRNLQGLLVYGLQNYFRLSTVYLWNDYKAIVLALTPFISRWWSAYTSGGNVRGESIIPGDVIFMLTTVVLSLPVVMFGIFDVPISVQELVASPRHYKVHRHKRFDTKKKLMWWLSACIHTCIILYTIINYWADHADALVIGVMTGQIIAVVTNMRLIFEARRGFHVADSWRLLIASFASMVLTIPVSNLNPAFDSERRLKISGTLDLPKLDWAHVQTVLLVAGICLAVDVMLYALFGESHVLSYWKRRNQTGAGSSQAVDDEDDDDDDAPPASHPKSD